MSLLSGILGSISSVAKAIVSTAKAAVSKAKSVVKTISSSVSNIAKAAIAAAKSPVTTAAKVVIQSSASTTVKASSSAVSNATNIIHSTAVGASGVATQVTQTIRAATTTPGSPSTFENIPIVGNLFQDVSSFVGQVGDGVVGLMLGLDTFLSTKLLAPLESDFDAIVKGNSRKDVFSRNPETGNLIVTTHNADEWDNARGALPQNSAQIEVGRIAGAIATIPSIFGVASAAARPWINSVARSAHYGDPNELPGVGDLVRFQQREVFSFDDRANQLSSYPSDDYFGAMQQQGYSRYWAENFWAAHWELPSVSQGYEMLYRLRPDQPIILPGKEVPVAPFGIQDLEKLMIKQDILPSEIQRLIAIAYQPYTRVDVRRMYKLKILDSVEEIKRAYLDLGYDDFKASKLASFVVADVGDDDVMSIRAELISAYKSGDIERSQLDELLMPTFRDPAMYALYIGIIDAQLQRKANGASSAGIAAAEKKPTLSVVKAWFKNGLISEEQSRAYLVKLNYSSDDIDLYLRQWKV